MSAQKEVAIRVKELTRKGKSASPTELALELSPEFPDISHNSLVRYCCADMVWGKARGPKISTTVIASDFHVPFHNVALCDNWLSLCNDMQPDNIAINGDFIDCLSISRFPTPPGSPQLQAELDVGFTFLSRLRRVCPDSNIEFLEGNHEQRLERLLMDNPGLFGLEALTIKALLELEKLDIGHHRYMDAVEFGRLTVVHGDKVSKHAGYTAKGTITDKDFANVVIGHTHRLGLYSRTGARGKSRAAEIGGMYDARQADYVKGIPNWQNGFAIWRESGDWDGLELVEASEDGRFYTNGKLYC